MVMVNYPSAKCKTVMSLLHWVHRTCERDQAPAGDAQFIHDQCAWVEQMVPDE